MLLPAAVPGHKGKPENLSMFVDRGRIAARAGGTPSLAYRYTRNIVV